MSDTSYEFPAFGICGFSGSGKTTLIERLYPRLVAQGLRVAIVKHDVHGLVLDKPGKDSERFFSMGSDIVLQGPEQSFVRLHGDGGATLAQVLELVTRHYDLVLVEGRKWTPYLNKVWLRRDADDVAPADAERILLDLGRDEDRVEPVVACIMEWLQAQWRQVPVYAGVLLGGRSSRMGQAKHLMQHAGRSWLEGVVDAVQGQVDRVVLLGEGALPPACADLPRLPDVVGLKGPRAGMLAAMRWAPRVSWLFVACDLPLITPAAVTWLLESRAPGVWATLPRQVGQDRVEPLFAHYDFRAHARLEAVNAPRELAEQDHTLHPTIPGEHADAWRNVNTPADLETLADSAS